MRIEITPAIVIPDMSPLIHLAAAEQLSLLHEFGRVIVMDIVAYEASSDLEKPWANEVAMWLKRGQAAGSNHPVEIVKTEVGEAYRLRLIPLTQVPLHIVCERFGRRANRTC
jgi:predicted nucleic acid-binding protein